MLEEVHHTFPCVHSYAQRLSADKDEIFIFLRKLSKKLKNKTLTLIKKFKAQFVLLFYDQSLFSSSLASFPLYKLHPDLCLIAKKIYNPGNEIRELAVLFSALNFSHFSSDFLFVENRLHKGWMQIHIISPSFLCLNLPENNFTFFSRK